MFIEFGILNYSLLIPLIYPFLFQIRRYIHEDSKFFYELLMDFLGYSLGGLFYLFINYRMKKLTEKKDENVDTIFGELEEKKVYNQMKELLKLLIIVMELVAVLL